jgi:hypothetical protein
MPCEYQLFSPAKGKGMARYRGAAGKTGYRRIAAQGQVAPLPAGEKNRPSRLPAGRAASLTLKPMHLHGIPLFLLSVRPLSACEWKRRRPDASKKRISRAILRQLYLFTRFNNSYY